MRGNVIEVFKNTITGYNGTIEIFNYTISRRKMDNKDEIGASEKSNTDTTANILKLLK